MAKADAWRAPGGRVFERRAVGLRGRDLAGGTRLIAEPAYRKLLAAEPFLRKLIPALIVTFLLVVAALRVLSLMNWHDETERNAKALLALATGQLVAVGGDPSTGDTQALLERIGRQGELSSGHVLVLTDAGFKVTAVSPTSMRWHGRALDGIVTGGQPLFLFGERAGVMDVRVGGGDWYAAVALMPDGTGAAAALVPQQAVFAEWRRTVSLNVSLFVLTAGVLLIILYAYFTQASR